MGSNVNRIILLEEQIVNQLNCWNSYIHVIIKITKSVRPNDVLKDTFMSENSASF